MVIISVPIRTNGEFRPSRLFSSMFRYIKKSMFTIVRACLMYKPGLVHRIWWYYHMNRRPSVVLYRWPIGLKTSGSY